MAYRNERYTPNARGREILARAWDHLQAVPYQVTARWLFYRLLQDGFYAGKNDYKNSFLPLLSRARHNSYREWRPDTLADDRRAPTERGGGFLSPEDWADAVARSMTCHLARWRDQEYYLEIWFEAEAMKAQFEHYTGDITLRPFFGMPSIPYKWEIAKALERAAEEYELRVIVIYFGDLDPAGEVIPETSVADIRVWCEVDFDFVRGGLNPGDEVRYAIPENFEHPGCYQWEALDDASARELITGTVARYVDYAAMAAIEAEEEQTTEKFRRYVAGFKELLS